MKKRLFYADLPTKVPEGMSYKVEGIVYPIGAGRAAENEGELKRAEELCQFYTWRGTWRTSQHPEFFTRQVLNYLAAAYCNLGLKHAERHDWEAAQTLYWKALAVDSHLSAAYNNLGVADFEQRRYPQAADHYRWALRYDPENPGYRRNLALALQKTTSYPH